MLDEMKRLNEVFTPANDGGIFTFLQALNVPWQEENIASTLNYHYHYSIAGTRYIAPLLTHLLGNNEVLSTSARQTIAGVAFNMFHNKWEKEYATLSAEYNPIENYDMTEALSGDKRETTYGKTDTFTHGKTETVTHNTTDTTTHNTSDTRTPNLQNVSETGIEGFNSSTYQDSEKVTSNETGTETRAKTGTEALARTGTEAHAETGSDTDAQSGKDTTTHEYTLTRHGNIGVTTSQQMLESERALWMWDFFYEVVFPDLNRVLTLSIY